MSDKKFNIVFKGEIVAGADEATVKANVAKLFKANDKVLERLFSGEPIAIKKDVDKAGAMKYRALMKQAGAVCYAQDPAEPMTPAQKPLAPKVEVAAPPSAKPQAVASQQTPTENAASDGEWSLAAPGAIIGELKKQQLIDIPDVSGITIAPVGADVLENPPEIEIAELPDISDIDLAPVGADVADPVVRNDPSPPDVSSMTMAPVGSDVADPQPEKPALKVDISHISLE